jgi:PKD repeat protein
MYMQRPFAQRTIRSLATVGTIRRRTVPFVSAIGVAVVLTLAPTVVFAQGSIFGTVQNADLSNPAVGELLWVGYLDNTDEEIRIESNVGAGYDGVNWFDDFQNYTTESAGNPYDYVFVNTTNGQAFVLSKTIPSNSFQQENILLGPLTIPARPTGLTAQVTSGARINLSWNYQSGVTYHVYRRATANNSTFRRLDSPSGNLANPGVADSFFVDATSDGVSDYTYTILGENASGNWSAHSVEVSILASAITAPAVASVDPDSGSSTGMPSVTVYGANFDIGGASVTFGGNLATNVVVVSPFELTCNVPTGVPGPVDVVVSNTASGSASTPLAGGFVYLGNQRPVLAAIGAQIVDEGDNLNFIAAATDADGDSLIFTAANVPVNATFLDNFNGTATFDFSPDFTQSGLYNVSIIVSDGALADTELVAITVNDISLQPVLTAIGPQSVDEGQNLNFGVTANDADGDSVILSAVGVPLNATFNDNFDGTGVFDFNPDYTQSGLYNVTIIASDGTLADTEIVAITVNDVNNAPVLAAIGPQSVDEGQNLNFNVSGTDINGDSLTFAALNVPVNATFNDNFNGTGTLDFNPDYTQSAIYNVSIIVSDGVLADTEVVTITVADVNRPPVLSAIGSQLVDEGQNLAFGVTATDPDGDSLVLTALDVPANATFNDNFNGTGSFDFSPDFTQSGVYNVTIIAADGVLADTEIVAITVNEGGNQRPVLTAIADTTIDENTTLVINAAAVDSDGDSLLLSATGVPANATFIDNFNGTGQFNFSPSFFQAGLYNVSIIASDGLLADTEAVSITVLNVNQLPVLAPIGSLNVQEGMLLSVLITASDADSTIPAITLQGAPSGAIFADSTNGRASFVFTPGFNQAGVYPLTFVASDGVAADSEQVTLTVTDAGNQPPVLAAIGNRVLQEGDSLFIRVTATDADLTIPVLSAVGVPVNASFVDSLNGAGGFIFRPSLTQGGVGYPITFIASDGIVADSEAVIITVTEIGNQAPIFDSIPPQTVAEGDTLTLLIHAVDPEGTQILMGTLEPFPDGVFADSGNGYGSFRYTPGYTRAGIDTLSILAIDQGSPPSSKTLRLQITTTETNLPPTLLPIGDRTVLAGDSLKIRVVATDSSAPPGNELFMATLNAPANSFYADSGNGVGGFRFYPTFGQIGAHQMTFLTTDNGDPAQVALETITITVQTQNQAPALATIGPKQVLEGGVISFNISATDPDGTIPFLTADSIPLNATFVDSGNGIGTFRFTPSYLQSGLYQVVFTASDGLMTDDEQVLIQVAEAGNQPPQFNTLPDTIAVVEKSTLQLLISAMDPESQSVSFFVSPELPNAILTDSGNAVALYTITPDYWQDAFYDLLFVVEDVTGAADSGVVVLEIIDIGNQMPDFVPIDTQFVLEQDILQFTVAALDSDLTIPTLTARPLPSFVSIVPQIDGTIDVSAAPLYTHAGVYDIYFVVTDAEDSGLQDSILVPLVVQDRNRRPTFIASSTNGSTVLMPQGDSITIWYRATDPDGPTPVMTATNLTSPNMTWADSGNGYVYLKFKPGFTELGNFFATFVATDSVYDTAMTLSSPPQTFSVGFTNVAPVIATIPPQNVIENDSLVFTVTATDANGQIPTLTALNLPTGATFTPLGGGQGEFRWTPTYTQAGNYNVSFRAQDASLADTETVSITVIEAGNQAPNWISAFPVDTQFLTVFTNVSMHVRAADVDNATLILTALPLPANAAFVDSTNKAGLFTFSPDSAQIDSSYVVTFIVADTSLADTAVVRYKILPFKRGDMNDDNAIDVFDVVLLVGVAFRNEPLPVPFDKGDIIVDGSIDVLDVVRLVDYVFRAGPPPPP